MGFMKMRVKSAVAVLTLSVAGVALGAAQDTENQNSIEKRINEVARTYGGPNYSMVNIRRIPDTAGLSQATQAIYIDSGGQSVSFIMLPDGQHIIRGTLEVWNPKLQDTADKNFALSAASSPQSVQKGMEYQNDWDFTGADFTDLGQSYFGNKEDSVDRYLNNLPKSRYIHDGSSNTIVYSLFDINCPACAKEYTVLRRLIDKGVVSVRWIPVVTASREPYLKLLTLTDDAFSNSERVDLIKSYMNNGDVVRLKSERKLVFTALIKNTALLSVLRHYKSSSASTGTPVTVFDTEGGPKLIRNYFDGYESVLLKELRVDDTIATK